MSINSAQRLFEKQREAEMLTHQKEFADMIKEQEQKQYDAECLKVSKMSLEISQKNLKVANWTLFFAFLTLCITIYTSIKP